ncbi:hypothetical protein EUX98_g8471 [Antrodiella citrinella]|uniref:Transcription initiation factor TFIID subunit 4 n=1 Tax=Antrodiella citrinella TaxID=2447956 RepID=A0A4S4M6W0_9APHY|nr:hypothetical protein EUX98_g8471 [Antrodiella citrinella]
MKTEDNVAQAAPQSTPAPQPAAAPTPTPQPIQTQSTFTAQAQWAQAPIPIDPALQQHAAAPAYQYYSHHYPQAQYSNYHHYAPPQQQQQHQAVAQQPQAARPQPVQTQPVQLQTQTQSQQQQQQQSNSIDTADIATLNDALGSAGVDLRAEEETLHRSTDQYHQYRPYEDRSRKQPLTPNFDARILGPIIRAIGAQHKVPIIREEAITYIALALRFRLQELLEAMIAASAHRTDNQFDRDPGLYEDGSPMWSVLVRSDVAKVLAAIEKVEREEEMKVRRERKEKAEAAAQASALAQQTATAAAMAVDVNVGGDEDGQPKKKKKKEGPGVTARNMSEDVRKKMSNAVASQAAGLSTQKYAWMNTAAATAPKAKTPAPAAATAPGVGTAATSGLSPATTTAPAASTMTGSRWARPYVSATNKPGQGTVQREEGDTRRVVTLRDAMFVVEKERGHGGGRGSAKGWT